MSAPRTPPLPPLHAVSARLARAGLTHALGGSGLLAALGLVDAVNDWDVTVEASPAELEGLFAGHAFAMHGNSGCHADHKLSFEGQPIELIARFAFFAPEGIVRIPTVVTGRWQGVPLGSPVGWAAAYALMGELENVPRRRERAERLFEWLERHGADRAGRDALLAQPLPADLRARISALPVAGAAEEGR